MKHGEVHFPVNGRCCTSCWRCQRSRPGCGTTMTWMVSACIGTYRHKGQTWLHGGYTRYFTSPTQVSFVGLSNWSLDAAWLGKERPQVWLNWWLPRWAAFFLTHVSGRNWAIAGSFPGRTLNISQAKPSTSRILGFWAQEDESMLTSVPWGSSKGGHCAMKMHTS